MCLASLYLFVFFLFQHATGDFDEMSYLDRKAIGPYLDYLLPADATFPPQLPFPLETAGTDLLFYVHIPKTAGQTFHRILSRSIKGCPLTSNECQYVFNSNGFGMAARFDVTFAQKTADTILLRNRSAVVSRFEKFAAGLGHTDVSIATQLPQRRVIFITMLREPIARLSSMYGYMSGNTNVAVECIKAMKHNSIFFPNSTSKGITENKTLDILCNEPMIRRRVLRASSLPIYLENVRQRFHKGLELHSATSPYIMGPTCLPPGTTFTEFLQSLKRAQYDNYVTRAVTGNTTRSFLDHSRMPALDEEQRLKLAKQMLIAFPFVGVTERFEDSVELFLWTFGFPSAPINKSFVYNKSRKKPSITRADEMRIRQMDRLDFELYEFGVQLFEERLELMRAAKQQQSEDDS